MSGTRAETIEFHYRCSDDEAASLDRRRMQATTRTERRGDESSARPGRLLNMALIALCDEVEAVDPGTLIIEFADAPLMPTTQRKVRLPQATRERVDGIVARLPGVSRDQFVRVALRRWTKV